MRGTEEPGLAATKIRPPQPPSRLVVRPRLFEVLDAAVSSAVRLVLVSAPAGSGKSTLVASWVAGRPEAVAWLQVEDTDADPVRFWTYLVEAIARSHPIDAASLKGLVRGSNGDEVVIVDALVAQLSAQPEPVVIVLDDHHLVVDSSTQRGVERLLDLCPPQVTVVIATRFDPPFRLGRLRVRDQMREVRGADLCFDVADAPALLGPAGWALDPDQLDALCVRTEGWAAGLVLAGISLERASDPDGFIEAFRGDDQLVVEYLRDELLASLAPADRRRLLETSILEQLTGDLVDAVTASTGGSTWLADTAARNQLLVPLDRTGTWFRYHHLLRDLLRLEAERELGDELASIHDRAATWLAADGQHGPAMTHFLAAGDREGAAALLFTYGPQLLSTGQIDTLRTLLVQLGDVARTVTWCALMMGWCELIGGRAPLAAGWLADMVAAAGPGFDHDVAVSLRMNISLATGNVAAALPAAAAMDDPEVLRQRPADLATAVGAAYAWAGRANDARRVLHLAIDKADADGLHTAGVLAGAYLSIVQLDAGTAEAAHVAADEVIGRARRYGLGEYRGLAPAYAIRARTGCDADAARTDAQHALDLARRAPTDLALGYVLCVVGDALLDLGDAVLGRALLAEARTLLDGCPDPGIVGGQLERAEARHRVARASRPADGALVEQLTDRELAVLRLLPSERSQREIAAELYVSLNTVKSHSRAIYRKLDVADRKAAVRAARLHDLL